MDGLGDLFGGVGDMLGEMFGGEAGAAEGVMGLGELLSPDGRRANEAGPAVYERYLCGGPRERNINDR